MAYLNFWSFIHITIFSSYLYTIQAYTYSYQKQTLHICSLRLLRITVPGTRNFSVSLHTCYPLSYSHITSNFVFTRSLISIVDYRFHHYLFLCRQCLRPSLPFKFVASRLQSLSDIVIPCVIVFVFPKVLHYC